MKTSKTGSPLAMPIEDLLQLGGALVYLVCKMRALNLRFDIHKVIPMRCL